MVEQKAKMIASCAEATASVVRCQFELEGHLLECILPSKIQIPVCEWEFTPATELVG